MSIAEQVAPGTVGRARPPSIEIVVPVHNEEIELEASVLRLRCFLDTSFPFDATVTIADNASTDRTWPIAALLARQVPGVRAVHLAEKGRGRALRAAWMASEATVVAYMDVDLATGLEALLPLVAPLLSGHSDVAIGTRLARGSRVVRGPKRELVSRSYNLIVRAALHNGFSDAQCGFKAVRTDVARSLLPLVLDETWFFDTELLVLAERSGLRVHEVPVDWTDDPDSRVDLRRTAVDDLRGVWRMMRAPMRPATPTAPAAAPPRATPTPPTSPPTPAVDAGAAVSAQLARLAGVGAVSTLAYLFLFLFLREPLGAYGANALALGLCAVANTYAHARVTFAGRAPSAATTLLGSSAVFSTSLALTTAGLALVGWAGPGASAVQLAALLVATALAALVRFTILRAWVFRAHLRSIPGRSGPDQSVAVAVRGTIRVPPTSPDHPGPPPPTGG